MSQPIDPDNAYESPTEQQEKKPKGCFFYGCLFVCIAAVLMLLLMVGLGVGGYMWAKGQVDKYTESEQADIPVSDATEEEIAEVQARVENLQQAVDADAPAAENEVVLTADDINALIASNDDLRGRVFMRIENGEISGDVSIPLDQMPMGKGRFLNGSATFDASYENGVPVVRLKNATVKGQPLPQPFLDGMADQNLAKDLLKDPDMAEKLRKFESIEVQEDKLILRLREPKNDPPQPPAAEAPPLPPEAEGEGESP